MAKFSWVNWFLCITGPTSVVSPISLTAWAKHGKVSWLFGASSHPLWLRMEHRGWVKENRAVVASPDSPCGSISRDAWCTGALIGQDEWKRICVLPVPLQTQLHNTAQLHICSEPDEHIVSQWWGTLQIIQTSVNSGAASLRIEATRAARGDGATRLHLMSAASDALTPR